MSHPHSHSDPGLALEGAAVAGPFVFGWSSVLMQVPGSSWLAVIGTVASIAGPLLIARERGKTDRRVIETEIEARYRAREAERDARIEVLQKQNVELFDRLTLAISTKLTEGDPR